MRKLRTAESRGATRFRASCAEATLIAGLCVSVLSGCLASDGQADAGGSGGGPAAVKQQTAGIAFPSGTFIPPAGERVQPALLRSLPREKGSERRTCAILLVEGGMTDGLRVALERAGVTLFGAYPEAGYRVELALDTVLRVSELPGIRWIGRPTPEHKVPPELLPVLRSGGGTETVRYHVHLYSPKVGARARKELGALPVRVERYEPSIGVALVSADAAGLRRVLELDTVLYVEPLGEVKAGAG